MPEDEMFCGFSEKRFVDIGQEFYTKFVSEMMEDIDFASYAETKESFRDWLRAGAEFSFLAAEEFSKVFQHQESKK